MDDGVTLMGVVVKLSPVPLWLVAGAITVTCRLGFAASCWTSASMPGAATPSSLVTSTRSGASGAARAGPRRRGEHAKNEGGGTDTHASL